MPRESNVAPKERVNIVYKPATEGAAQDVELPLKMLVMGDFTSEEDTRPIEERKPINVNKENFSNVMQNQNLHLDISVADKLSGEPESSLGLNLRFESLKDFEPEGIAKQVEPLRQLLALRQALHALKGPMGNVPAFRKMIQAALTDEASRQRLMKELSAKTTDAESEKV